MIVERAGTGARDFDCLGYATFVDKLQEERFKRWFVPLEDSLMGVERAPERLAHLQDALVDLVDFLYGGEVPGREKIELRTL